MGNFFEDLVGNVTYFVEDVVDVISDFVEDVGDFLQDGLMSLLGLDDLIDDIRDENDGTLVSKRGLVEYLPVIYGRRIVGGTLINVEVTGPNNEYLWLIYAIADGSSPHLSPPNVLIDDVPSTDQKYSGHVLIEYALGGHTAQPFVQYESESAVWTSNHRLLGTVAVAVRLKWNRDIFNGIPNIKFEVFGSGIINVRSLPSQIVISSDNPVDALYDYLTNPIYGKGLSTVDGEDLDIESFKTAAVYCDELITSYSGGPSHQRFKCNLVMPMKNKIIDNIPVILQTFRGTLPYINGVFHCIVEKHYTPQDYGDTDYFEFNEDNILGNWSIKSGDVNSRYNRVKLTYPNEAIGFKSDYVVVESTAFRIEDTRLLEKTVSVRGITNTYRAIDMASTVLRRSRNQILVSFTSTQEALSVTAGQIVKVTHSTPGWNGKLFRVNKLRLLKSGNIAVILSEHEPTTYDLSIPNEVPTSPDTNLPDPNYVKPPTNVLAESDEPQLLQLSDGTLIPRIKLSWAIPADIFVSGYDIEYKPSSDLEWVPAGYINSRDTTYTYILNVVESNQYDIRIRSRNDNNKTSDWVVVNNHVVIGKTSNPSDVLNFAFVIDENGLSLKWDRVSDLDVVAYEIRVGGADWQSAATVAIVDTSSILIGPVQNGQYIYRIKAIDSGGRYSDIDTTQTIDINPATAPVLNYEFKGNNIILSWTSVSGSLNTSFYRLFINHPDNGNILIGEFKANELTYKVDWTGSADFSIAAVDIAGNQGTLRTITANVIRPQVQNVTANTFIASSVQVTWSVSQGTFAVDYYEIRLQLPGETTSTKIASTRSDTFNLPISWYDTTTIHIVAYDIVGNSSLPESVICSVNRPSTPILAASVDGQNLVLSWSESSGSLPIEYYDIRFNEGSNANFSTATKLSNSRTTSYSFQLTATTERTYLVKAVDTAGNESDVGVIQFTPSAPSAVVFNPFKISGSTVTLSWSVPSSDLPVIEYVILEGLTLSTATVLTRVKSTDYSFDGYWVGTKRFWVRPIDSAMDDLNRQSGTLDNVGPAASQDVVLSVPEPLVSVDVTFLENNVILTWSNPVSDLPIDSYIIRRGTNKNLVAVVDARSFSLVPDWAGIEDFYISAINTAGGISQDFQVDVNVVVPNAPTINTPTIQSDRVEFTWLYDVNNQYTGSLPINGYDIRHDSGSGNFQSATKILVTGTDGFSRKVDWSGNRRFWVTPIDTSGNLGQPATVSVVVNIPAQVSINPQVIDNNVLLYWSDATSTLPIDHYEVRRGDDYNTSDFIGTISSRFTTIFETQSGTYTYWVTGIDTAGNKGLPAKTSINVSEPPDYILFDTQVDTGFTGNKTNAIVNSSGNLNLPVNATETFEQHFISNTWQTPNDQINAGYPIYIEPTPSTASYVKEWDLGTVLQNLSITANITYSVIDGDIILSDTAASRWTLTISTSLDGVTWTDYAANVFKVFSPSFRYVRIAIDVVTDTGDDLLEISELSYVIDVKEKSDAGSGEITNASTGAQVSFNKQFVDISSITVSPYFDTANGDTIQNLKAIYDFEDIPNPTNFIVYLLDSNGNKVTGKFSWNAKGR